jgi:hypothetical protein
VVKATQNKTMKKQLAKLLKAYHKKWDCFGSLIKCKKKK